MRYTGPYNRQSHPRPSRATQSTTNANRTRPSPPHPKKTCPNSPKQSQTIPNGLTRPPAAHPPPTNFPGPSARDPRIRYTAPYNRQSHPRPRRAAQSTTNANRTRPSPPHPKKQKNLPKRSQMHAPMLPPPIPRQPISPTPVQEIRIYATLALTTANRARGPAATAHSATNENRLPIPTHTVPTLPRAPPPSLPSHALSAHCPPFPQKCQNVRPNPPAAPAQKDTARSARTIPGFTRPGTTEHTRKQSKKWRPTTTQSASISTPKTFYYGRHLGISADSGRHWSTFIGPKRPSPCTPKSAAIAAPAAPSGT